MTQNYSLKTSRVTVTAYNLETGASRVVSIFKDVPSSGEVVTGPYACSDAGQNASVKARSQFSPDFGFIATSWSDAKDGSSHVGWINSTGKTTDATSAVTKSSDFSAAPKLSNPMFTAKGDFVFHDDTKRQFTYIASTSLAFLKNQAETYPGTDSIVTAPGYVDDAGNVSSRDSLRVVSADGSHEANASNGGDKILGWINNSTVVALGGKKLIAYPAGPFGAGSYLDSSTATPLTTETDYLFSGAVASPDKTKIGFLARRGNTYSLFTLPASGGDPVKVTDLMIDPNTTFTQLLAWK